MKVAAIATILMAMAGALGSAPAALAQTTAPPQRGHYRTIAVPRAAQTMPEDITNLGLIVGCYQSASGPTKGFTLRRGRFTTITDPAASHTSQLRGCVLGANSHGVLTGYYLSGSGVEHGFVDHGGRFTAVNVPGAGRRSGEGTVPVDINDSGEVAGYYFTSHHGERGFVLRHGRFTTVRYPGSRGTWASGIADNGTVAGGYISRRGVLHGFLESGRVFSSIQVPGAAAARGQGHRPGVHFPAHRPGRGDLLAGPFVAAGGVQLPGRRLPHAERPGRHRRDRAAVRQRPGPDRGRLLHRRRGTARLRVHPAHLARR